MIYEVTIKDLSDAEGYAFGPKNDFDLWISAVDIQDKHKMNRMTRLFHKKGIKHCVSYFYDWSDEDNDPYIQRNIEIDGPKLEDLAQIIGFLSPYVIDNKVHKLGVNCFAGISRSTAIGIIALVMSGKTPQNALEYIRAIRPQAWPNLRILRIAGTILNKDLYTPVKQWKNY